MLIRKSLGRLSGKPNVAERSKAKPLPKPRLAFCMQSLTTRSSSKYCITLYFRGKKISRKVNLKYFREKIFSRIYCSRENIFPRKYLPAKISSRENILSRKYLLAKISSRENIFPRFFPVPQICRLVGLVYAAATYCFLRYLTVDSVTSGKALTA